MTLLEVLLALTILLISLAAIGRLVDLGSEQAVQAQMQSRGTRLALSKLGEVEAGVIPISGGGQGTFDEEGEPDWSWNVDSSAQGAANLYEVTVKVSRTVKGRPFEISLTQWIVDPSQQASPAPAQSPSTSTTASGSSSSSGSSSTGGSSP